MSAHAARAERQSVTLVTWRRSFFCAFFFFVVGFAEFFSPKGGLTPRGIPPRKKGGPRVLFMESLYSRRHARARRGSRVSRRRVRGVTRRACRSFGAPFAALGAVRDDGRSSSHLGQNVG